MADCTAAKAQPPNTVASPPVANGGCSLAAASELMTQSTRRTGKTSTMLAVCGSILKAAEGHGVDADAATPPKAKRLKLCDDPAEEGHEAAAETALAAALTAGAGPSATAAAAGAGCNGHAVTLGGPAQIAGHVPGKGGKGVMDIVFSPLMNVFHRAHAAATASAGPLLAQGPTGAAAGAEAEARAPQPAASAEAAPQAAANGTLAPPPAGPSAAAGSGHGHAGGLGLATVAAAHAAQAHHHAHHPPAPEVPEAAESEYDEEDDELGFDPLLFIKSLPPLEQCIPRHRPALLPRQTRQCKLKTLVLDLDETLVHSSLEHTSSSDFSFGVFFNNQEHTIHVKQRPHLHEFMHSVAEQFEVVVFTASQKVYAEKLLNVIDPKRNLIKHRIYRESCVIVDGNYLKDLTVLGRDLRNTFIVDNSPQAFGFQPNNGIPIESWYDDESDTELLKLLPFLHSLADVDDVRPHIASKFRLKELIDKIQL